MNICILAKTTLVHNMGGMEVHLKTISETVSKMGHKVVIISTRHPQGLDYEEKNGCHIYYLNNTIPARYTKSWWRESKKKVIELHNEYKFDVIWSEAFAGYYYAWKVKPIIKVPIVCVLHGLGITGHIKSEWSRISTIREYMHFFTKFLPEAILFYTFWFYRTLKYSDGIIGVSDKTIAAVRKEFKVPSNKTFVVYNGIDTEVFKPDENQKYEVRQKYSLDNQTKIILMSAVIHKQKGIHYGLEAFVEIKRKISNVKLMIVGDGPHFAFMKQLTDKLSIEKDVVFCGRIPNEQISKYYNTCDVFINPTIRDEGLPFTIVEAMSCGKPVITSNIGGIKSTIEDGINGFFVKPKDVNMLAEKTIEVLSNKKTAESFGQDARKKAAEKFSKTKMANDYLNISRKFNGDYKRA